MKYTPCIRMTEYIVNIDCLPMEKDAFKLE